MDAYGGTCLNHGCILSKAFVSTTDVAHRAGSAEHMGVYADPAVDMQGLVTWRGHLVRRLTIGVESLCEGAGVNLIGGRAEFASAEKARIVHQGEGEGVETVEFEQCVLATGSRPIGLPGFAFDGECIFSSRTWAKKARHSLRSRRGNRAPVARGCYLLDPVYGFSARPPLSTPA